MKIDERSSLEPIAPILTLPAAESRSISIRDQAELSETAAPGRGLAPLAGAALAFLGHEVAPRLVDVLITALEHRLKRTTTAVAPLSTSTRRLTKQNKGQRRQARYRGGQPGIRNLKERR